MDVKNLKKQIVDFLTDKGEYESYDESLVNEYVANVEYCLASRRDIKKHGITITEIRNTRGEEYPIKKKNPSFDIYYKSLESMRHIAGKLAITPADRIRLKMIAEEEVGDDLAEFD
jgi:P27 family predicted phage terminase small subunit